MSATSTVHALRMRLSYNDRAMPRLLDRYVWKELVAPFAIGVGVFTFFLIIDRIYQLTTLVITKNVPFQLVLSLLVFLLPAFLSLTLPMALLVAVLLVGGRLAGDLEVAALKAAGVSPLRLFRPFVAAALLVMVLIGWLTLVAVPWSIGAFQQQLFKILQSRAATGITERTFTSAFGQFVVYVDDVSPSQLALHGVVLSDERDPQRSRIVVAREGRLLTDEANRRITLRFLDGAINEAEAADPRRFRHTAFSLYDMTLPIASPLTGRSRDEKPEKEMSLGRLAEVARELEDKAQTASPYYVERHKRFALPMAALVFVLVGFPLGIRSHRGGRAVALASSFLIVVSYYILFTALEGMALSRRLPAALAIWLPNLLFSALGVILLWSTTAGVSTAWLERFWHLWARVEPRPWMRVAWTRARRPRIGRIRGPRASTFLIDRYLIREYLMFLGFGLGMGAVLFIVVDLLQTLDRFLRISPP